jgi:hypothetical protein
MNRCESLKLVNVIVFEKNGIVTAASIGHTPD